MSEPVKAHSASQEGMEENLDFLRPHFGAETFPWVQVWGYIGSLVLTFVAFFLVVDHVMSPILLLAVILTLAVGQAALQLGVFMHLRESRGLAWQIVPLGLAFMIALGMVGMSIWIMTFKSGVS